MLQGPAVRALIAVLLLQTVLKEPQKQNPGNPGHFDVPQKVLFLVSYLSPAGLSFMHLSTGAPEHRLIIHGLYSQQNGI